MSATPQRHQAHQAHQAPQLKAVAGDSKQKRQQAIEQALAVLVAPGSVFEVRILGALKNKSAICSGYFDDVSKAAAAIVPYDSTAKGVYLTLNPVDAALLSRACNRIEQWARETTKDEHITRRLWLALDCDPVRISGISSNELEHQAALERAAGIRDWLGEQGWCAPVEGDSGNGAHLLYRIDLRNDKESGELVARVLKALHQRFSDDVVNIDTTMGNASRISKLYGTMTRKGDSTPERPHRRARLVAVPQHQGIVSRAQLEALVAASLDDAHNEQSDTAPPATTSAASEHATSTSKRQRAWNETIAKKRFETAAEMVRSPAHHNLAGHHAARLAAGKLLGGLIPHGLATEEQIVAWLLAAKTPENDAHKEEKAIRDGIAIGQREPLDLPALPAEDRPRQARTAGEQAGAAPTSTVPGGEQGGEQDGDAGITAIDITDKNLGRATKQIWDAMQQSEYANQLYRYGSAPAYLNGKLHVLDRFTWRGIVNRVASFVETKLTKDGIRTEEVLPPLPMIQDSLIDIFLPEWLPVIERVAPLPVLDQHGNLQTNGYHEQSKTLVQSDIDLMPMDTSAALALLDEVFCDFPFASQSDKANLLAYLLAPFYREMCGSVPLFLVDAAQRGTGKGLLNDLVHTVWTGEPAGLSDLPLNAEEQRKQITTHLLNAPLSVTFDDISLLTGHAIQRAITATTWRDRLLGRNEETTLPVRCIWAASGNNVTLGGDMVRRVVLIRLESDEENPSQREGFRRSESELREWVRDNRHALVSACVALCQHGLAHGTPQAIKMGGFARFARTVSTILDGIGVAGFYENMQQTFEREDGRQAGWKAIVHAWYEAHGTDLVRAGDIAKLIENDTECEILLEGDTARARDISAGKLLKQRDGSVFAFPGTRLQIQKTHNNKGKARYRLKELDFAPPGALAGGDDIPHQEASAPSSPSSPYSRTGFTTCAHARAQEKKQASDLGYLGYLGQAHQDAESAQEPGQATDLVDTAAAPPCTAAAPPAPAAPDEAATPAPPAPAPPATYSHGKRGSPPTATPDDIAAVAGLLTSEGIPRGWHWDTARPHQLVSERGLRTSMDVDKERVVAEAISRALGWRIERAHAAYEALLAQRDAA
jgi:hypothetical protein